ncbi:MAG TPA: GrpB family protein, partial [Acidimicrobiales bacterium]|nr:GrpB family protein [Acidimicrobiales bacterium]
MRIVRFDAEVSLPVSRSGSRFKVAPLIRAGAGAGVEVVHVPAGGLVGRHEATVRQLFAVVAGVGWVSGQEGRRRGLRAGYAALWEQGEDHEAGSDTGLTAVCVEGDFDVLATTVTRDIVVCDYDPEWPRHFEEVRAEVWPAVEDIALGVDHVGSTAVPGIAAKPVIDVDIVVASDDD